ncbi:MAG: alpha-1,2-fucosyltransferase, partial [Bacteroidia bacterium]
GGLGNQMFQYAFGKSLALKHNVNLKLDISALNDKSIKEEYTIRNFALGNFNVHADLASAQEIKQFVKNKAGKLIDLASLYFPFKAENFYLREPSFSFFKKAFNAPANSYVDGYWQTEEYFSSIRKELLKELSPIKSLSPESILIADKMRKGESVSIHVRRGDYISIPQNNVLFETCSESYYYEAIKMIRNKFPDSFFYIFSDEPEWFKNNIRIDFPVEFVTHNIRENSYEDLVLMSLCKHNIIANSSFSWWGAWLNENPDKIVIAPKHWFKDKSKNTKNLIPQKWIQI